MRKKKCRASSRNCHDLSKNLKKHNFKNSTLFDNTQYEKLSWSRLKDKLTALIVVKEAKTSSKSLSLFSLEK